MTDLMTRAPSRRRARLPGADRALPARAAGALLPDPRVGAGRRGHASRRRCWRPGGPRRLRGAGVVALVAVPDRDQPVAERAARAPRPPRAWLIRRCPSRAASASRSGCSRSRTSSSRGCPTTPRGRRPGTRRARRSRSPSCPACSACPRSSAPCSSCATCSATAPTRSATCSRRARPPSTARCSGPAPPSRPHPSAPSAARSPNRRPSARVLAAFSDALERGDVDRMVSLLREDAWLRMPPGAARVPGPPRDRRILAHPRHHHQHRAQARPDPRQRPARLRVLRPGPPRGRVPRRRDARAGARRRPHHDRHALRGHRRAAVLRPAPHHPENGMPVRRRVLCRDASGRGEPR